MGKKEGGQALILVLILLSIGALLIVPSLRLISTSFKSTQIVTRDTKALYAADAAQEYVLWKLTYDDFVSEFTYDDQELTFSFDVCGMPVEVAVVMRALEGVGGVELATDDAIRPTKTVEPNAHEESFQTYTYTINLKQVSNDISEGLDAIYDILPRGFEGTDYLPGSSYLRAGGAWELIPDPLPEEQYTQLRLRWPASGNFASPIRDFEPGQEKELKFQISGTLANNKVHHNWVVLKPWNTLSGSQAAISVDTDDNFGEFGMMEFIKTANPEIIQPGVEAAIEYTITMTNTFDQRHLIYQITDILPPGFSYSGSTSGITTSDPQLSLEDFGGIDRWVLRWTEEEFPDQKVVNIDAGVTLTLTFLALGTRDVSGSYYNEFTVHSDQDVPDIFSDLGITDEDFCTSYSWNTGRIIVPAYDSSADAEGVTIDSNIGLTPDGCCILSWHVK